MKDASRPMAWLNMISKKKKKGKSKKHSMSEFGMPESSSGKIRSGEYAMGKRKIPGKMRKLSLKMSPQAPGIKLHGHGYSNSTHK
jgi:hypothetical protein